jgi:hypothetical protein
MVAAPGPVLGSAAAQTGKARSHHSLKAQGCATSQKHPGVRTGDCAKPAVVKSAARRPGVKLVTVSTAPAQPAKSAPTAVISAPLSTTGGLSVASTQPVTPSATTSTATTATTTSSTTNPASAWSQPALTNPITIQVTPANFNLKLNSSQDYILQCPSGTLNLTSPLTIAGGHNVMLQNCNVYLTVTNWALELRNQTGTLWIHDVHLGGVSLSGGVQMQEPGATVVMRDVLFDKVYGSKSTNHAELIQTWSGPQRLLIDGLTGSTTYQGLFLLPNQYNSGPAPTVFDLRNIDIDDSQGAYALWLGNVTGATANNAAAGIGTWNVQNVHVVPNPARSWTGWWLWPKPSTPDPTWSTVIAGAPAGGSYVHATATGAAGVDEGVAPTVLAGEQP